MEFTYSDDTFPTLMIHDYIKKSANNQNPSKASLMFTVYFFMIITVKAVLSDTV